MVDRPKLLIDVHHAEGAPHVLPRDWLHGFDVAVYEPGRVDRVVQGSFGLAEAEAVVLRSVTPLGADALGRAPRLRAAATCSSGTDHVDLRALAQRGVPLFSGRGGNAVAVAEWVAWALCRQWGVDPASARPWAGRRVVVVGVGAVGGCVAALVRQWGGEAVLVDPPRKRAEPDFPGVSLRAALLDPCDALTLHVPRVRTGPDRTVGLLGDAALRQLGGATVLNAARGDVLDERAASAARGQLAGLWCDTFANEPSPSRQTVAMADGVSPHVAGHSVAGKLKVAWLPMVQLRAALGLAPACDLEAAVSAARAAVATSQPSPQDAFAVLDAASRQLQHGADFRGLRAAHRRFEGGLLAVRSAAAALSEVRCPPELVDACFVL